MSSDYDDMTPSERHAAAIVDALMEVNAAIVDPKQVGVEDLAARILVAAIGGYCASGHVNGAEAGIRAFCGTNTATSAAKDCFDIAEAFVAEAEERAAKEDEAP